MKKKKKYISVATRMLLVQQIATLFDYEPDRIHNIACIQDSAQFRGARVPFPNTESESLYFLYPNHKQGVP